MLCAFSGIEYIIVMQYFPTIGLEIHAELKTRTKMFCNSKNDADETRPNVNVCPVCLAHPGTLPVINREAVRHVLRVGVAVKGRIADYTEFDRKNYFYPDLPKGYQLSQYEYPLVSGGELLGVTLTRIHLEEDTASSMHGSTVLTTGEEGSATTTIDYNRAGIPLMELVTEPVIKSVEEASLFARELQQLLRYLGTSNANMEKGEMRVEANISLLPKSQITNHKSQTNSNDQIPKLGIKVEIKNLNSFRAMERAVAYEIKRQTELLDRGEKVVQETRGWDESKQSTFPQRIKEGSADYRYFPDPDLPSLKLSEVSGCTEDEIKNTLPELPWERRMRYLALGLKSEDAEMFVREPRIGDFMDEVSRSYKGDSKKTKLVANYIANDLMKLIRDSRERDSEIQHDIPISVQHFKKIMDMLFNTRISSRSAKDMLISFAGGETADPDEYAKKHKILRDPGGDDVLPIVEKVLADNPEVVADYRGGKEAALEYLVGQAMRALRGAADPIALRSKFKETIK